MRVSTAFTTIEDPADPAWIGHAVAPRSGRWRQARVWAAACAAVAIGLLGVTAAQSRGEETSRVVRVASSEAGQPRVVAVPAVAARSAATMSPATASNPTSTRRSSPRSIPPARSGWAPAAATVRPQDAGSGLLVGDLAGVNPMLIARLDALAVVLDRELEVISGWRTRHEQVGLYRRYVTGQGSLAAVPGTSKHEIGRAADVYVDGVALANVPGVVAKAAALGLHFPVAGEAWHVEPL